MKAIVVPNTFTLQSIATIEGVLCLVVDCKDFDAYVSLPAALSYSGRQCGKTGWCSDKGLAYYQSNAKVAHA
jgi:hypothetical protein